MTKQFGVGGEVRGGGLNFPQIGVRDAALVLINGVSRLPSVVAFWDAVALDRSESGWESKRLTLSLDTTEQTIVDLSSGSQGVLTQVLSAGMESIGAVITIRVTIDGELFIFTHTTTSTLASRLALGWLMPTRTASSSFSVGEGVSDQDSGYDAASAADYVYSNPFWALKNGIGIPFTDSLKVTVQSDVAPTATLFRNEAGCSYLNTLPVGL